jgi:outer membrane protein assembly factor BamD (BamD/ComL family)
MRGMKFFAGLFFFLLFAATASAAYGQGAVRGRIEPPRDETLEIKAKHNLDVAKYYITRRKAYDGARDRLQEIIETYPDFSRMDEVIYWMGELHLKLDKKEQAADYYNKLLKVYPESELAKKARARLDELKQNEEVKR